MHSIVNKKISVIIPVYNAEAFIEKTLKSIIEQSHKPDEIIVIDDCSRDDTFEILNKYSKLYNGYVNVYRNSSNKGISETRNIGMNYAEGDLILFMDHDDIAERNLLEKEYNRFIELSHRYNNIVLVHSSYIQINEYGEIISGISSWKQIEPKEILGYLFVRNFILTASGVLLDKKAVLKVGGFNPQILYSQDWELWIKLAKDNMFGYVNEPLIKVRRFSKNTSNNINNFLHDEKEILMMHELGFIRQAIFQRNLPYEDNMIDYVSILARLDYWNEVFINTEKIFKVNKNFSTAYFFKGLYYIKFEIIDKAIESFEKVLYINEENGAALNNLAALFLINKDYQNVERLLRKALQIFPNYIDANYNLQLLNKNSKSLMFSDVKFTWRELRKVLLNYGK